MSIKLSTISLVVLLLTSCSGNYREQIAREYYLLDTDKGLLCLEGRGQCYSLSLIGPSYQERLIAEGYRLPNRAYRWHTKDLQRLMLEPPNDLYHPQRRSEHLYRLPPVYAVHCVWDVLAWENYILYDRDDQFDLLERPVPRRF